MQQKLRLYNTLSKTKEDFEPISAPLVGMYVCGPTVYGDAHVGHARAAVTFDVVYRYLDHLGYNVRYVRNITDVGHLVQDADDGEDKIARKAKLEDLEPMEVVQNYMNSYHRDMALLNTRRPSIEPRATGHIVEQIEMVEELIDAGYAYESEGSVYFDVQKYAQNYHYGKLSGRKIEDLQSGTRLLEGQEGKKSPFDFALWKKASAGHIMRWNSPWSKGFPGWHLECSTMSAKYLGDRFDIHGGGMDLLFPHHECEIAQSEAAHGQGPAKYWMHNNMVTINGQKMGKSLGNAITLQQLFTGNNALLDQGYSPMTIRFFILQAHYRSTLDFSNEALLAARKGYKKIVNGLKTAKALQYKTEAGSAEDEKAITQINGQIDACYKAMNDDLNTALAIGNLFHLLKKINSLHTGALKFSDLGEKTFSSLKNTYISFVEDILGIVEEKPDDIDGMIDAIVMVYKDAKADKAYDKVDSIRAVLKKQGVVLKDMKDRVDWSYEE